MSFDVVEWENDRVRCVFDKPYMDFPHRFRMEILYVLSEKGLEQRTRITNLSDSNMPVFLGYHTTFNTCFLAHAKPGNIRVLAEVDREIQRNMENYLPTGKLLPADRITEQLQSGTFSAAGKIISRHYHACGAGRMELLDTESGIRLVYENDENFPWRLLYSADGDGYFCMEPMSCMVNAPNAPFDREDTGFVWIEPGKTREYVSKIYLQEGNR